MLKNVSQLLSFKRRAKADLPKTAPDKKFKWYITTVNSLDDSFLSICVDSIRQHSKMPIQNILIPKRLEKNYTINKFRDIEVKFIDTSQPRLAGISRRVFRVNKRVKDMDEEHGRLIGYGCTEFPSCVVDADLYVLDDRIDDFVWNWKYRTISCIVPLMEPEKAWTWCTRKTKWYVYDDRNPFCHFVGIGHLRQDQQLEVIKRFKHILSESFINKYFISNPLRRDLGQKLLDCL